MYFYCIYFIDLQICNIELDNPKPLCILGLQLIGRLITQPLLYLKSQFLLQAVANMSECDELRNLPVVASQSIWEPGFT